MKKRFLSLIMTVVFSGSLLIPFASSANPALDTVNWNELRIRLEAENFDRAAGEGVGYHDLTPDIVEINATYKAKMHPNFVSPTDWAPVEVLVLNLSGNPDCLCRFVEMDEGEWLRYTVNVPEAGDYRIGPSVASAEAISMTVSVNGGAEQEINCPKERKVNDSGYNFQDIKVRNDYETWITLNEGANTITLKNTGSFFYMEHIDITRNYVLDAEHPTASVGGAGNYTPRRSFGGTAWSMLIGGMMEWKVNIREGGRFNIGVINCAGDVTSGNFFVDGKAILEGFSYPLASNGNPAIGGWHWLQLANGIPLTTGEHTVRLAYNAGPGMQVDAVVVTRVGDLSPWETNFDLDQDTAGEIFAALAATTSAEQVESVLRENQETLGLNLDLELDAIADKSMFYRHLAGKSYGGYHAFITDFAQYVYFETINQGTVEVIDGVLSDVGKCSYMGIEAGKLNLLTAGEDRNAFLAEIAAQEDMKTVDTLKTLIDEIWPGYFWKNLGREEMSFTPGEKSVYAGSGLELPLQFSSELTDVAEINLTVAGDDAFFKGIRQNLLNAGDTAAETEPGKATLKFTPERPASGVPGSFTLTTPAEPGSYTLTVTGSISYNFGGYAIPTTLAPSEVKVTLTSAPRRPATDSKGGGSKGGGGSGGKGSSVFVPVALPEPDDTKGDDTKGDDKPADEVVFTDLQSVTWAQESIQALKDRGVISQSEDNTFRPNDSITREEFLKMTVMASGALADDAEASFGDVEKENWCYPYVASAQKLGIVNGDADGNFGLGQKITRQDMAVILYRTLSMLKGDLLTQDTQQEPFADDTAIADYAKEAVYAMRGLNMINGVGENRFEPDGAATRAAAAKMIYEMIKAVGI